MRALSSILFAACGLLVLSGAEAVLDIGARKQLFIDHKFIEHAEGVTLRMHTPARTGDVLIKPDAEWEKDLRIASYSSVALENGKVRVWYQVSGLDAPKGKNPDFMAVAYAESKDGIHFEKPVLNLVEYKGSKRNNIVMPPDPKLLAMGGGSVAIDRNPNCPPSERYKSWQKIYPKPGTNIFGPYRVLVSADGLHWRLTDKKVTGLRAADTQPTWFWDPHVKRYIGYSREWVNFNDGGRIRMASYNESGDMHTWDNMHISLEPDELDFAAAPRKMVDPRTMKIERETWVPKVLAPRRRDPAETGSVFDDPVPTPGAPLDIYGPGVFPYLEADSVYVSMTAIFHHWGAASYDSFPDTGDVRLALSRDRRHFFHISREPFLRPGPAGSFDSKWLWPMPTPIRMGDELWFYYLGMNQTHSRGVDPASAAFQSGISRAVLRLDGFVSASFDYAGGTLVTPPMTFQGTRLELNLDTAAGGMGRVEILDAGGAPIPGFTLLDADPLNGNSVRMVASWNGKQDLSALAGKPVRLRFKMRGAHLYAFQFQ